MLFWFVSLGRHVPSARKGVGGGMMGERLFDIRGEQRETSIGFPFFGGKERRREGGGMEREKRESEETLTVEEKRDSV